MSTKVFIELVSSIGTVINVVAYFPQIIELLKKKDSTGNSLVAWYMWLIANVILAAYAIYIADPVFTILEVLYVLLNFVTIVLVHKYRVKKVQ